MAGEPTNQHAVPRSAAMELALLMELARLMSVLGAAPYTRSFLRLHTPGTAEVPGSEILLPLDIPTRLSGLLDTYYFS